VVSPRWWCSASEETTALDRLQGCGAHGTGRRVARCSGEDVAGVGGAGGWLVRVVDGRHSAAEE
jgi:hypothetical protein